MEATTRAELRLDEALEVLRATPRVLRAALEPLGEGWLAARRAPGTWSPVDVLGHLIQGEREDWIPRARAILQAGEREPFAPFDRDGHAAVTRGRSPGELLDTFDELRRLNLADLESLELGAADLARTGRHPVLGRVTLAELLATWVVHDLSHLAQIPRAMAARYAGAVGPWGDPDYLPILTR